MGNQAEQRQQQGVEPLEHNDAQHAPCDRGTQTDIAVQIEGHSAVVPPAGVGGVFQNVAANPLNDGGIDGAEHQQEEPSVADVPQGEGDDQRADAVQNTQRPA